ncbi:MAG: hypothetical protein AAB649_00475 [Patescibacteria group bacterium]
MKTRMFFPEYLEAGATDVRAVKLLQFWLLFAGCNDKIRITGSFFLPTGIGVRKLQEDLEFSGEGVDAKFGPLTRNTVALMRKCYIDSIPVNFFERNKAALGGELFFPQSVELLSKDPAALKLLQTALLFAGCNNEIVADGIDGTETANGLKVLQRDLGFPEKFWTGKLDDKTRVALFAQRGLDLSSIPADIFEVKAPARVGMQA